MAVKKVAVQAVDPKEAEALTKEIAPYAAKAEMMKISNAQHMVQATETLSVLNKYADSVKEKKESVTKPLNVALKAARGLFSPLEDKLESAIGSIRRAMIDYQTEQKRIADKEADKIAARVDKGTLKAETAVRKMGDIEKPAEAIATDSGSIKFKTVEKFEVMDVTLLTKDYLLPNEVAIRKAMLAGIKINGVRYYTEKVPVNSR